MKCRELGLGQTRCNVFFLDFPSFFEFREPLLIFQEFCFLSEEETDSWLAAVIWGIEKLYIHITKPAGTFGLQFVPNAGTWKCS